MSAIYLKILSMTKIANDYKSVRKILSRLPKSLNEAMDFENRTQDTPLSDEPESYEPQGPGEAQPKASESEMNVTAFIDDIRKKSLRGMAQLADNPDDERYQLLKKIWQICEKKPEIPQVPPRPDAGSAHV